MVQTLRQFRVLLAAIATALLVSACGGGAESALALLAGGVGSGGTGIGVVRGIGIITGFGSLIVDGVRREDAAASYLSEEDQAAATAMASTGAALGQRVEYSYDAGGALSTVLVSPELVGPVSAASAASITVLGTKVTINTDTALGPVTGLIGYSSPSAIAVGDRVAVYGVLKTDAQGISTIQATLIAQKGAGTGIRLTGYVANFNAATGVFSLGNNTVSLASAAITPAGSTLSNGQLVTIWSDASNVGGTIVANTVRIKLQPTETGDRVLSGSISSYVSTANFRLFNVGIDATNATVSPAGAMLAEGRYAVAVGRFDAATNKLTATSVTLYAPAPGKSVELHGTILNFVSASSFTVRGVVVDASAASFTGGSAKDLANGVYVDLSGAIQNNVVRATEIAINSANPMQAPKGSVLDVEGTIESYDPRTGAYAIRLDSGQNMTGNMGSAVFYEKGSVIDLAVGKSVTVHGTLSDGGMTTSVIRFNPQTAPGPSGGAKAPTAQIEGVAYNVLGTTFMVNGITLHTSGAVIEGAGTAGIRQGSPVRVEFSQVGGSYMATTIRMRGN